MGYWGTVEMGLAEDDVILLAQEVHSAVGP
jgi:hypothetical protein